MPSFPLQTTGPIEPDALRVLITGFGVCTYPISGMTFNLHTIQTQSQPFFRYTENPSWLAARRLHNARFIVEPSSERAPAPGPPEQMAVSEDTEIPAAARQVHITTLQIPVTYQAVLSIVPGLHASPPILPFVADHSLVSIPPPAKGYDFIFHIGVAGRGPLRLEKLSHKFGYRMKDAHGQYAPTVHLPKEGHGESEAQRIESERVLLGLGGGKGRILSPGMLGELGEGNPNDSIESLPTRGFEKGYENFADELYTDIDVAKLIHHLKEIGIEVRVCRQNTEAFC